MPAKSKKGDQAEIIVDMKVSIDVRLYNGVEQTESILTLNSIVEEVRDDGSIVIHMPIYQGFHYPLPRDEELIMRTVFEERLFMLPVKFADRIESGGIAYARMLRQGPVVERQLRDCYRINCSLPVTIVAENKSGTSKNSHNTYHGRTLNFSDGGMLLAIDEKLDDGDKISMTFDIGAVETVDGVVLRSFKMEEGDFLFRVAVQFDNNDKLQKRRFYKYVVDKQLEQMRRWTLGGRGSV